MSQVAKKTTSRALPGPRVTVRALPSAAGPPRAATRRLAGVCAAIVPSDSMLDSFGWPGSRPDTSVARTWADWVTLEYAIVVR